MKLAIAAALAAFCFAGSAFADTTLTATLSAPPTQAKFIAAHAAVSYTHLDVYKRQPSRRRARSSTRELMTGDARAAVEIAPPLTEAPDRIEVKET